MSIISVEGLGKKYLIGHHRSSKDFVGQPTFREAVTTSARALYKRVRHPLSPNRARILSEEFWALRDLNFEVQQGDRVGIIGRNGAGKSTLLKILSRITEPTEGRIEIDGRVASLLEVGTGFHPELSGRENIYLNGSILGMTRADIRKRFDEIVAFAEVERFLDTPVKRYSSGMHVRLAFAVAAHLEPEILIVDEVLAVGDVAFQKKCLGKMEDVSEEGRTILFVSHNMAAVRQLCSVGMLLENGGIVQHGEIRLVISAYLSHHIGPESSLAQRHDRIGSGAIRFVDIIFKTPDDETVNHTETNQTLVIELRTRSQPDFAFTRLTIGIAFFDLMRTRVFTILSDEHNADLSGLQTRGALRVTIPNLPLRPGTYSVDLFAAAPDTSPSSYCDVIEDAARFTVSDSILALGARPIRPHDHGIFQAVEFD